MTFPTRNGVFPRDSSDAAKIYLARGLSPIPLPPRSKGDGLSEGWKEMRLTPEIIDQHFPRGYSRNIGILNGSPSSNTLDVDLDCDEALHAASILLPSTDWIFGRKSSPRSHWIYRADRSLNSAAEKYTDIDGAVLIELRGTGGQTVYPPSIHKETGELIFWDQFGDPGKVPLAALQQAVREVAAVALLAQHWPTKGTRQDTYLALVGGLMRARWEQERIERFVEALTLATEDEEARKRIQVVSQTCAAQERDRKTCGWPKLEKLLGEQGKAVVSIVREWLGMVSAPSSTTKKQARRLDSYRPFPVEALPEPIAEYVRQGAVALGCDPAYLALPALSVAASAIGNTRSVRLKGTWFEPSIVWGAIVGDSGTLKSPAYLSAVSHLIRSQKRLHKEFKVKQAEYANELFAYESAKSKAKKGGPNPGDPPVPPIHHRVVCSDTTIEKLAEILEDNPRGTLVARDELAGWLASFMRYKGKGGGTDLPAWLEMFRAGSVLIDRKTTERKNIFIDRATVSIAGGIQPGVLARALTPEFLDSGLAARLLMAMPPKKPKRWSEAEISLDVEQAYHDTIDRLLALDFNTKDDERVPHVLRLSPDAKKAWISFYNSWGLEQAGVEGELAAAFSKLEAYAARFALIHHVVGLVCRGEDDLVPIEVSSVEAGITLCRWFAGEARRIYSTLAESDDQCDTRRLFEWIQARGTKTTAKELQRSSSRKYPTADDAKQALDALVEAGLGSWVDRPTAGRGGRPTSDFILLQPSDDTDDTDDTYRDDDDLAPDGTPKMSDDTPNPSDETPSKKPVLGVSSVSSVSSQGSNDGIQASETVTEMEGVSSDAVGVSSDGSGVSSDNATYQLVSHRAGLDVVLTALDGTDLVGLDLETTGLDPRKDRIRLLSLALDTTDGGSFAYLIDCFELDPAPLFETLAAKELVLHNAAFDLAFLAQRNFTPSGKIHDTMLLAQLMTAGTFEKVSLAACCQRWLNRTIEKTGQKSDWSGQLSEGQLAYAALDVEVLPALLKALRTKIKEASLAKVAEIEQRCLPSLVWMARKGVALDRAGWQAIADAADADANRLRGELDAKAPNKPGEMFTSWNWESPPQIKLALELVGCPVTSTADEQLAALDHPLARLLRDYRGASKRGSTYGTDWLAHVADNGRVYPHWRQIGAGTGRMSCSDPNMQQLPRGDYRRCVVAPPGRLLVKADYSQIELRIAAKVSGDKALLEAYQRGDDLHTRTARSVLGVEEVTKEHRQLAKALNFGLLYGMGAKGFSRYAKSNYGMNLTEEEAAQYRKAFFKTYPGLAAWHIKIGSMRTAQTRTLIKRRLLLNDKTPGTLRLNAPIQGSGADGLKLALALLWERRDQVPGAFPVMAVHDEIVVEADVDQADTVAAWLKSAMVEAMAPMIEPVPVEVEVKVSRTWGGG